MGITFNFVGQVIIDNVCKVVNIEATVGSIRRAIEEKLIDPKRASLEHRPGDFGERMDLRSSVNGTSTAQDTTCVNVVDRNGNAFSAQPSRSPTSEGDRPPNRYAI